MHSGASGPSKLSIFGVSFIMTEAYTVQLNYVIPASLDILLTRYCEQNMSSPSALIRRLVLEYVEHDRDIDKAIHPKGRRTTVTLPQRLLEALEVRIEDDGHETKAAVIAALLGQFLPSRVHNEQTVHVALDVPADVFSVIYGEFGPGPVESVFKSAMGSLSAEILDRDQSKSESSSKAHQAKGGR